LFADGVVFGFGTEGEGQIVGLDGFHETTVLYGHVAEEFKLLLVYEN
jgi:hypothetical protein